MRFAVTKRFTFDAAHFLPRVLAGHRCSRLHGHTYVVEVTAEAGGLTAEGWVMDFGELSKACLGVAAALDHRLLNDVIENPTAENVAVYILNATPKVTSVVVRETPDSWCEVFR